MAEFSLLRTNAAHTPHPTYAQAEAFLLAAFDALTEQIAILDETGHILQVNTCWRTCTADRFFGAGLGRGADYLAACRQLALPTAVKLADGVMAVLEQQYDNFVLEYATSSPERWYTVRVTRFEWYDAPRLIVAHQNITELKLVQHQLQASKLRLEAILNNVVNGILTLDVSGRILTSNSAMMRIFGYRTNEIIGKPLTALLAPPYHEMDPARLVAIIAADTPGHALEGQRHTGEIFPLYMAISDMSLDAQTIFTAVLQDTSARQQLESERQQKERLALALDDERELRQTKNRFISMMSHELKTPLAAIRLASDFLKRYSDRATAEEKAEALLTIETQVDYLGEIVDDVTALSKTDTLAQDLHFEIYDLETYLRDILEELEWVHQATHQLIYEGPGRRVEAEFDRKLLRRAILNLLSNAIKYSPQGGDVRLTLTIRHDEALITITDQGIGISVADLPYLFETFHRGENVGNLPGTGLGLAIARQAVELHAGHIAAESKLGEGTTFRIRLPLSQQGGE